MRIYIASSWKNEHAVRMLTALLRAKGHTVESFVENAGREEHNAQSGKMDFDEWVMSKEGGEKFDYDVNCAMQADLLVYIGPSGTDAWAEVGAAYGRGVTIVGLWAKGEQAGLLRRMVTWVRDYTEIVEFVGNGG